MRIIPKSSFFYIAITCSLLSFSCSNQTLYQPPPPSFFAIGGTVVNLAGANGGLVLQDNSGDNLTVSANGSFTFPTTIVGGSAYSVTILAQPSAPSQTCAVTAGTGTALAPVSAIQVDCGHQQWTWMGGSNGINQPGAYGTMGITASSNIPGARTQANTWIDTAGTVWLFGGYGMDANNSSGPLNDLWKYSTGQWTWVAGSKFVFQAGSYGSLGIAGSGNVPGARINAFSWLDSQGNLWLFGGVGMDSTGVRNVLNDLWKFSNGQWTWMGGPKLSGQLGTYGAMGTPAANNIPGARQGSATWVDNNGVFWLFGGNGYDSTGAQGHLNDLWKYSAGQWTWVNGSNLAYPSANYGALGIPAANNVPGPRYAETTWTDASGNLWLFGGFGSAAAGPFQLLNDLWKYSAGQWTWMGGSQAGGQLSAYGTKGTASAGNIPGARYSSVGWKDASGTFWLFGGWGMDSTNTQGYLNDLWKYSGGQWTWMGGAKLGNQPGTYGSLGATAPANFPGGRSAFNGWIDLNGNLWLFGGADSTLTIAVCGCSNDVWKYYP